MTSKGENMSLQERFTEDELFHLTNAPYLVGSAMVFAEGSGLGTIKELYANAKAFLNGAKKFSDNSVITSILPQMEDAKAVREETKKFQSKAKEDFRARGIKSKEDMKAYADEELQTALATLAAKANDTEASQYKEWILSIAENVANAAKEGGFLGFGGERISEGEKEFYSKVASSMGLDAKLV
jgi:hypothetical protein